MTIIGYEIKLADDRRKRVGLLGKAPPGSLPLFSNKVILYIRVAHWNAVLHNIQHTGIDCEVWRDARARGAQAVVKYFFDRRQLVIVPALEIERANAVPTDNERRQFIMPLDRCIRLSNQSPLTMSEPSDWLTI